MRFTPVAICSIVALAGAASAAEAGSERTTQLPPRFTLLVRSRPPEPIVLLSIGPGAPGQPSRITYLDDAGAKQTRDLSEIVALAPPSWVPTPETTAPTTDEFGTSDLPVHRLDLTDGERFVGSLARQAEQSSGADAAPNKSSGDEPVLFAHPKLGTLSFPLDRVWRYWRNARVAPSSGMRPFSTANDTVLLADDRLEGLVTRLGPTIAIELAAVGPGATSGSAHPAPSSAPAPPPASSIDAGHVVMVNLVNPLVPLHSARVELADGTVLAASELAGDSQSGKLTLRAQAAGPAAQAVTLDLAQLAGVAPDPAAIIPLSTLPISAQHAASGRVGATPAQTLADAGMPLSAADILLPGPMTVEWAIPAGARSLLGYAQMDDQSFTWGDCEVVVSIASPATPGAPERELARGRLNATSPSLTITGDLGGAHPGDVLRVRTDSGTRGPIQDRVVLRRMLLLSK